MKIITADERLAEPRGAKIAIAGVYGVGKTSLLGTLEPHVSLSDTLFVDVEAGDLAVCGLPVASVRPRKWSELQDLACVIGGPNPALPATAAYSTEHYKAVMNNPELALLAKFKTVFMDSVTAISRCCFTFCEQQPESVSERGKKDLRGTFGLLGRLMPSFINHVQHARDRNIVFVTLLEQSTDDYGTKSWELQLTGNQTRSQLPGIVDELITMATITFDDKPRRCFVCTDNPWQFPAKDRSGKLKQLEEPNLGKLIAKLTRAERSK